VIWAKGKARIESGRKMNPHGAGIIVVSDETFLPPIDAIMAKISDFLALEPGDLP
jgi:hypothetical protein